MAKNTWSIPSASEGIFDRIPGCVPNTSAFGKLVSGYLMSAHAGCGRERMAAVDRGCVKTRCNVGGIAEDDPVWAIDVFIDELELKDLGFQGADPAATGRPGYHPSTLLKSHRQPRRPLCQALLPVRKSGSIRRFVMAPTSATFRSSRRMPVVLATRRRPTAHLPAFDSWEAQFVDQGKQEQHWNTDELHAQ
jgi:hypothetical protein